MTRVFFVAFTFFALIVWSETALGQSQKAATRKVVEKKPLEADILTGMNLIAKSDCAACHKADVKLLGPSYLSISGKYPATEANYTFLADKIIKGGSGTWGQIPMSPHADIAVKDAKKMVQYILSVKTAGAVKQETKK